MSWVEKCAIYLILCNKLCPFPGMLNNFPPNMALHERFTAGWSVKLSTGCIDTKNHPYKKHDSNKSWTLHSKLFHFPTWLHLATNVCPVVLDVQLRHRIDLYASHLSFGFVCSQHSNTICNGYRTKPRGEWWSSHSPIWESPLPAAFELGSKARQLVTPEETFQQWVALSGCKCLNNQFILLIAIGASY